MQKPGVIRHRVRHFGGTFANTVLLGPYALLFLFFIAAPIIVAVVLSFTYFNMVSTRNGTALRTTSRPLRRTTCSCATCCRI